MDHELEIAKKYGLFWGGSWVEMEHGFETVDGLYIYQPERFSDIFFPLFDKLRQLNDYCFHQLLSSEEKLLELTSERNRAVARPDCDAAEVLYFDDVIPHWQANAGTISRVVPIVLLSSFVEWGLKLVATEFCSSVPRKSAPSMSDFQFLIQHLQANSGLSFQIDQELFEAVDLFRSARNAFAHGRWRDLESQMENISLRNCFTAVSSIFQKIEEAAWQSPWATKDI